MSMASSISNLSIFSLLLLLSLSPSPAESQSIDPSSSVYEILSHFGFPVGLLPDCVKTYSYNPIDGSFVVELEKPSYVQFDYLVYFDSWIVGTIHNSTITGLSGVHVNSFLFLWFLVNEIKVDSSRNFISFLFAVIYMKLDFHKFDTIHSCEPAVSFSSEIPFLRQIPLEDEMAMILME